MTKIAGSGSASQRHGSADPDPDPPQNFMVPEHWFFGLKIVKFFYADPEPGSGIILTLDGGSRIF